MKVNSIIKSVLVVVAISFSGSFSMAQSSNQVKHEFPALSYAYNALEPYIDATTMEIHYSKHHRAYYDNFLKAVSGTEYEKLSIEQLFSQISAAPAAVRNMGGGYYNHNLFWENLSPVQSSPSPELLKAIEANFVNVDGFIAAFNKAASSVFGSGWAWLIVTSDGGLKITTTANQDNPLMDVATVKGNPLLTLDVWEHAYYLKYQNKRADYISAFWKVVNWDMVNKRYNQFVTK